LLTSAELTQLSGMEIGILINNVGVAYDMPDYFFNVPEEKVWQLINVNCNGGCGSL